MKHIIDHPKTRSDAARLARYARLDRHNAASEEKEEVKVSRNHRTRRDSEKLRRFTTIERQSD